MILVWVILDQKRPESPIDLDELVPKSVAPLRVVCEATHRKTKPPHIGITNINSARIKEEVVGETSIVIS